MLSRWGGHPRGLNPVKFFWLRNRNNLGLFLLLILPGVLFFLHSALSMNSKRKCPSAKKGVCHDICGGYGNPKSASARQTHLAAFAVDPGRYRRLLCSLLSRLAHSFRCSARNRGRASDGARVDCIICPSATFHSPSIFRQLADHPSRVVASENSRL